MVQNVFETLIVHENAFNKAPFDVSVKMLVSIIKKFTGLGTIHVLCFIALHTFASGR